MQAPGRLHKWSRSTEHLRPHIPTHTHAGLLAWSADAPGSEDGTLLAHRSSGCKLPRASPRLLIQQSDHVWPAYSQYDAPSPGHGGQVGLRPSGSAEDGCHLQRGGIYAVVTCPFSVQVEADQGIGTSRAESMTRRHRCLLNPSHTAIDCAMRTDGGLAANHQSQLASGPTRTLSMTRSFMPPSVRTTLGGRW